VRLVVADSFPGLQRSGVGQGRDEACRAAREPLGADAGRGEGQVDAPSPARNPAPAAARGKLAPAVRACGPGGSVARTRGQPRAGGHRDGGVDPGARRRSRDRSDPGMLRSPAARQAVHANTISSLTVPATA
jgi:hypothetical protein